MSTFDQAIKDLIEYGKRTSLITPDETDYSAGRVFALFGEAPGELPQDTVFNHLEDAGSAIDEGWILDEILKQFIQAGLKKGMCIDEASKAALRASVMDCIMPRPHELIEAFHAFYRKDSADAGSWFAEFSRNSAITGDRAHLNYRAIPVDVCGEPWELSYPQPALFEENFSLRYCAAKPLERKTAVYDRMMDFLSKFRDYSVCAAITPGPVEPFGYEISGGKVTFPIETVDMLGRFAAEEYSQVECFISEWPLSCVRLASYNDSGLCALASRISDVWQGYSDPGLGIAPTGAPASDGNISYALARNDKNITVVDIVLLKAGSTFDIAEVFGLKKDAATASHIDPKRDCVFPDDEAGHHGFERFIKEISKN